MCSIITQSSPSVPSHDSYIPRRSNLDTFFDSPINSIIKKSRTKIKSVTQRITASFRRDEYSSFRLSRMAEGITAFFRDLLGQSVPQKKRAVISGQSISGMIAAVILAQSGYEVDAYDKRDKYTRNIQWAVRPALVNELASIDKKLADLFLEKVARPLHRGSIHIKNGKIRPNPHDNLKNVNAYEIPYNGREMMTIPSAYTVEARVFEEVLKEYILKHVPNVRIHTGSIKVEEAGESFTVKNLGEVPPDLIVIAEGGNSDTRNKLGILPKPMTEPRWQIAGAIKLDSGGVMIKHWREENERCMLTGVIGHAGADKTWIVADVDPLKCIDQQKIKAEFRQYAAHQLQKPIEEINELTIQDLRVEQDRLLITGVIGPEGADNPRIVADVDPSKCTDQQKIDAEFKRLAALALQEPLDKINELTIYGPADELPVSLFPLQQTITDTAAIGDNVVLIGDAVGVSHWSAGGGMQIAAVCHAEHLKAFVLDLHKATISKKEALKTYSKGVLRDTKAWGKVGAIDFYPLTPIRDISSKGLRAPYEIPLSSEVAAAMFTIFGRTPAWLENMDDRKLHFG